MSRNSHKLNVFLTHVNPLVPFFVILMTSCNINILALLPFVRGIHWSTVTGGFLSWSQITWIFYVFFGVCLNKHCSRRWFVAPRCPYDITVLITGTPTWSVIVESADATTINDLRTSAGMTLTEYLVIFFFCQRFCSLKRFDVTFVNGVMPFKMSNEGEINIAALREVQCTVNTYWFSSSGLIYPARKSCIVSNGFVLSFFVLMKRDAIFAWSSATAIIKNSWVNKYYGVCVSNYFCDISHKHTHTHTHIYIYMCVYVIIFTSNRKCQDYVYIKWEYRSTM